VGCYRRHSLSRWSLVTVYVHYRADRDYDMGSATEMMVNDFDDERTLDEEEALEGSEDSHNELSNLQKVYPRDI
jgi:hypothetical protein